MTSFLLHTDPQGRKTIYSYQSHVPKDVSKYEIEEIDIPTDKNGLREAFQEVLNMVDPTIFEDCQDSEDGETPEQPKPILPDVTLQTREQFDEAWNNFPLSLQLHYASLATEEARTKIGN